MTATLTPRDGAVWLGIDLGTQSVRAMVVRDDGEVLATASHPLTSRRAGREHTQNPELWWRAVCTCIRAVTLNLPANAIAGLAVDATSGTVLLTDEALRPASEALMYDDGRAETEALEVQAAGAELWAELGYCIQPAWALPKLLRLARTTDPGRLASLRLTHQNDFINNHLAGTPLATDWSHSLKTGFDLLRTAWPFALFTDLGLPRTLFPEVVPPATLLGHVCPAAAAETGLLAGTPIHAGMTDSCAAQIASGATSPGEWNSVLGTTLVLKGVTHARLHDPLGVVYSHRAPSGAWLPGGASSTGAGALSVALPGAHLDGLSVKAAQRSPTTVICYPLASPGERFPFHAPSATAFTLGSPRDDVEQYLSILQGVAFIERLAFDDLDLLGAPVDGELFLSGGAVRSPLWNQLRADILHRPVTLAAITEPAFGMAVLAASHASSLAETAARMVRRGRVIPPRRDFALYGDLYSKLLRELRDHGWVPEALYTHALGRVKAAGNSTTPAPEGPSV